MYSMKASIQNFICEFKAVVFQKGEFEYRREMTELEALWPPLANQVSKSDVKSIFNIFGSEVSASNRMLSIDTLMEIKLIKVDLKKDKLEYRVRSRPKAFSGNSDRSQNHKSGKIQPFPNRIFKLK